MSGTGQNGGMTRYRPRAVLLLFLVLNLTACSSWQNIGPVSPGQFIELDQPERVRVDMRGGDQVELERPAVDGDELVASGVSVPLADILRLQVRGFSLDRTMLLGLGVAGGVLGGLILLLLWDGSFDLSRL